MSITRDQIASALRGQTFQLPNFDTVHQGWPFATSPHLEWLREVGDKFIQWLNTQNWVIADPKVVSKKLKAVNIEVYVAKVYPDEPRETLRSIVHAQLWMFLWDDEVDSFSGHLGEDFEKAEKFRESTLRYIRYALQLTDEASDLSDDVLITSFSVIANPLLDAPEQVRKDYCDALEQAIRATAIEQRYRQKPFLPGVNDYLKHRYHTIGLPTNHVLLCGLIGISAYAMTEMKELEYCSTMITAMANDIISLRKELQEGTPDSLVPILWPHSQDLQKAVDEACAMMEELRGRFDRAEHTVLQSCADDSLKEVKTYIRTLKTQVTGNYVWSMASKRYGMAQFNMNGVYHVKL